MSNLKPRTYNLEPNSGFTLIELMVAISIMAILATIMLVNLAGQRAARDLKIAENQLVSDIRATQSSTLSSRLLPSGNEAQYYFIKFDLNYPTQYTIEAIFNARVAPQLEDVQTINFPPNIRLSAQTPIQIFGRPNPNLQLPSYPSDCALVAFAAPFGKVLLNQGCGIASLPLVNNGDDYYNIINFITNVPCTNSAAPYFPPNCSVSSDSTMIITLTDTANTVSKQITINGTTGSIIFN